MENVQFIINRIKELCDLKEITVHSLLVHCGLNTTLVANMQRKGTIPSVKSISKIAECFDIPIEFLIGSPPFNEWEHIRYDAKGFLEQSNIGEFYIYKYGTIDKSTGHFSFYHFIKLIGAVVKNVSVIGDPTYDEKLLQYRYKYKIVLKPEYSGELSDNEEWKSFDQRYLKFVANKNSDFVNKLETECSLLSKADKQIILELIPILRKYRSSETEKHDKKES